MKVLVTGGAGFIGSHLTEALCAAGHRVRVLDNLSSGRLLNLKAVQRDIEFIRGDIRNTSVLRRAVRGREVVFHQAALRSVPKSVANPLEYHEVNATATLALLNAAHEAGVRRVVYASSSSVYGDVPLPQREDGPARPQSPYAASKLSGEIYAAMIGRLLGLQTVGLRYFNVFGPRQSLENQYAVAIPRFITCLLTKRPCPIHGSGRQTRDFTYVENVVRANLMAARSPRASGGVFNVGCGERHSVLELARLLGEAMDIAIAPVHRPPRPGDPPHSWADIEKAKKILGYRVVVPFQEGLARTIAWFSANRSFWEAPGP